MTKHQIMADTNNPIATVQRMYAAFGAGDLETLIETVHPDSRWTYFAPTRSQVRRSLSGRRA